MRVLVVDDDDDTRVLLAHGLMRLGFVTATAVGVAEALRALTDATVHAVVTDWHLGSETAVAVVEAAGDRRVVVVTGDERALDRSWPSHVRVRKKPASLAQLAQALREP